MPIFKVTNEKTRAIKSERKKDFFEREFELRDFFKENLEQLLGVRFLEKEYPITEGRIDTLGIDEDDSPVIIEYKWDTDDRVLAQGLAYYTWLQENRRPFQDLVRSKLGGDIQVNWDQPRVILVAQDFSRQIKSAVRNIEHVKLVTYACYEPDILHLEGVEIFSNRIIGHVIDEGGNAVLYDRGYHFSKTNSDEVKEKIELLRGKVVELPDVEEILGQMTGISYKTTRKFVRFSFMPNHIQILLKNPAYTRDEKKIVRDIVSWRIGYNGLIKFDADSNVDYVFEIIKEAYEQTQ